MNLIIVTLLVFIINIPFGFWRASVRKLSVKWFLAIHIPVPFIILLRIYGNIGFAFYTYIFLVGAFFLGQRFGGYVYNKREWLYEKIMTCISNIC